MNAQFESVALRFSAEEARFQSAGRLYQGVPTVAATKGGRLFVGWCSGGNGEPRIENFDIVYYSDDGGDTWCKFPLVVIESDRERMIHAFDIQLWVDRKNALHIMWVQEDARLRRPGEVTKWTPENPIAGGEGYIFEDFLHCMWEIVCEDPDAETLVFSEPRHLFKGFLRCKPLETESGKIFAFAYDQLDDRYGFNVCEDGVKWKRRKGGRKYLTPFDEGMAYQLWDGSIRMLARCEGGALAETWSYDDGENWTDGAISDITSPSSRFYVSRTPGGRVIVACNDHEKSRCRMTVKLSDDDGKTWPWSLCVDERGDISYPDIDFIDDKIYLVYDRGRRTENEILMAVFTEEDIIKGNRPQVRILSKPGVTEI